MGPLPLPGLGYEVLDECNAAETGKTGMGSELRGKVRSVVWEELRVEEPPGAEAQHAVRYLGLELGRGEWGGTDTGGDDLRQAQQRMRGEPGRVLRQGRPSFPGDRAVGMFRDLQRRLCRHSLMLGEEGCGHPQSLPWKASPLPRHELFPEARESLSPWL